jgi:hypothetical protein
MPGIREPRPAERLSVREFRSRPLRRQIENAGGSHLPARAGEVIQQSEVVVILHDSIDTDAEETRR